MTGPRTGDSVRKPRADAQRNRLRLLEAAKAGFAEKGATVSLEEIARAAGVGIGTLYRHFPTRDALIEQVYQNESQQLAAAAAALSATCPPVEALRGWMLLFVDYLATKQIMVEALNALTGSASRIHAAAGGATLKDAIAMLTGRAVAHGDIRLNMDPLDLLRAIGGVAYKGEGGWQDDARRLVDILIAGLRANRTAEQDMIRPG
jgi:AcrR family transcriptional regulator